MALTSQPDWAGGTLFFNSIAGGVPNVWRVRVDEATGTRIGDPEPVMRATQSTGAASMGADGRRLLFKSGHSEISLERYAFDAARGRLSPEAHPIVSGSRDFRLQRGSASPDGEWLATIVWDAVYRQDLVLVGVRTGETRRLTDDPLREDQVEWAPDGSKLYFVVAPSGRSEVWSIRPDGSGRERVASAGADEDVVTVLASPDGRSLYVEVGEEHRPHWADLGVPYAERRLEALPPLGTGRAFAAAGWSPDGRWLAGQAFSREGGLRPGLVVYDREARRYEELADLKTLRGCAWLPDSRRILLWQGGKLELLDRESRSITPVGSLGDDVTRVALSRDGRSLFALRWNRQYDIWMLDYGPSRK